MLFKLILLLTVVPLIELYLLVRLTQATNFAVTVAVILTTGVVGAILAKMEGLRVLRNVQKDMAEGRLPADGLIDGAMILVAGALLVTPGMLTDTVGFLFILPPSRALFRKMIKRLIKRKVEQGQVKVYQDMCFGPIQDEPPGDSAGEEDADRLK